MADRAARAILGPVAGCASAADGPAAERGPTAPPPPVRLLCPCCRQAMPEPRPDPVALLDFIRLSGTQRAIVETLARRFGRWVDTEQLVDRVYQLDPDGGPLTAANGMSVHLGRIRPRLAAAGLVVEGGSGRNSPGRRLIWRDLAGRAV